MSQHDELFQELGRTLDVAPSRNFASGVHKRIARRRVMTRAAMSGLAIAASVAVVALVQWPTNEHTATVQMAAPATVATSTATAAPEAAMTQRAQPQPSRRQRVAIERARIQVITNQMAVLQAAWAAGLLMTRETDAPIIPAAETAEPAQVVVEPVRVAPVEIVRIER